MRSAIKLAPRLALAGAAILALAGAGPDDFDVRTQIGPNPVLPDPQQYLLPPMHLAKVVGWKAGETPKVTSDLRIQALATGLEHPRSVYTLPNGDVLVVETRSPGIEPIRRPKSIVMGWMESKVTSGGQSTGSNRITLLRDSCWRWQTGGQNGLPRPSIFAVRGGAGRQRSLRRQHRCDLAFSLQHRRHRYYGSGNRVDAIAGRTD